MTSQQQADPQLLALVAAYQTQTAALRTRLSSYVLALWRSFNRHDNAALAQYVAAVVPVASGAQLQMSALTVAFLAHQRQLALGGVFKPLSIDPRLVTGAAVRAGTPATEVAARPFHVTWNQLHVLPHADDSVAKALKAGERRAVSIVTTDLQRTKVLTQQQVTKSDRRIAYTRRILEGPHSCGLCIVASTQRYKRAELMPIHPGCDCGQEIVYADRDPGRILDLSTLQGVHDRLDQRFGSSSSAADIIPGAVDAQGLPLRYRDAIVTHEHDELGPVLGVRGQYFSTLADFVA